MTKKVKEYYFYMAFLVIAILAFWQIALFIHPAKWDMMDVYYPWRFHVGECLRNGKFPFWNPYQHLGYPIHADPSSGAWYPPVWLIGYVFGYNIYTIGLEMWLHVFVAGIGFFKLCTTLKLSRPVAFMAAVCYMLSGIFIGNAQHITSAISACWLPFILNYYLKMCEEARIGNSVKAAFFLFLLLTGGYPAFTIMLFYLLLILFFYYGITYFRGTDRKAVLNFLGRNGLFFVLAVLLSSGMLLSVSEATPYISRTSNFPLADALFCPFSPQCSVSFLLPFAAIKDMDFFATDLSMTNAYFGALMFLFFILGISIKKPVQYKILWGFGLFSLLAAFGAYLPVREFLFNYVPFMNLFRFPSTFRLYTIIGFLLVGAYWFNNFIGPDFGRNRKKLMALVGATILVFVVSVLYLRTQGYLGMGEFIRNDLFHVSKTSTLRQHIAFQAIVQSMILGLFLILLWKMKEKKNTFIKYAGLLLVFEMIFNARLNTPYTAYYEECSARESHGHIKKFPSGFPQLPDRAIADIAPGEISFGPFWRNVGIFQKQIYPDGFNSFIFTGYESFRDRMPQLFSEVIKNKIVFLSDEVHEESEIPKFRQDSSFSGRMLFFKPAEFEKLKEYAMETSSADSVHLVYFAPDSFIASAVSEKPQMITLLQNNYKGWQVFVNDNPVDVFTANHSLISAVLPPGKNKISFVYQNTGVKSAAWVCVLALIVSAGLILFDWRKGRSRVL